MLEELHLTNFRIFDNEVAVRFKPITVLIGGNNAGKSSIIGFLLMLQQSLSQNSNSYLVSKGDRVKLGSFNELKNSKSGKKNLKFTLKAKETSSPSDALTLYIIDKQLAYRNNLHYYISANVAYSGVLGPRGRSTMSTIVGNQKLFSLDTPVTENSRFMRFADVIQRTVQNPRKSTAIQYCLDSAALRISQLQHIGPVKDRLPWRIDIEEPIGTSSVGQLGRDSLHLLYHLLQNSSAEKQKFLYTYLDRVLNICHVEFTGEEQVKCVASNKATSAKTNIANFGFGVSQCLPILVQGANMRQHDTLIIEQPEAQIHPTAQLELGSFFADLAKQNIYSIIETHSSNILLRLRSLVALGKNHGGLSPEDVSVAYFHVTTKGKASITNLSINEDGSMQDGLPLEFFGADIEEGLKLSAAKYYQDHGHEE